VIVTLPLTDGVRDFAERHARRAVTVPPQDAEGAGPDAPGRGRVEVRIVEVEKDEEAAALAGDLLTDDVHHLVVFARNDDVAADLGDRLALRGFGVGAPGDSDAPVWLVVDDLTGRQALDALPAGRGVAVSFDVPADPDALDRRHGGGHGGMILAEAREAAHLRDVAARTGYRLHFDAPRVTRPRAGGDLAALLGRIEAAISSRDVEAYELVLEPLVRKHGASVVGAAAVALLRSEKAAEIAAPPRPTGRDASAESAMTMLFVSLGSKDDIKPGDLVGAITGEARIAGEQIGRIEIRETFSRIEVAREVANRVIAALNGTTVRGRSVRVDLDRSERGGRGGGPRGRPTSGRSGGGRRPRT
jgi:ATP-dependent RNA helicase DeaD